MQIKEKIILLNKSEIDNNKKIILYCGAGGQGALATKTLQDMGFQ